MELDIRHILRLARRWWWLLLLAPAVAMATARYLDARQPRETPRYQAAATILVNPIQSTGRTAYLTATYERLVVSGSVLRPVVDRLALPFDWRRLRGMVAPSADPKSNLVVIGVVDVDPARAAAIANAVAEQFTVYMADQANRSTSSARTALNSQKAEAETAIDELETEIQALELSANATDPSVQTKIDGLRASLARLQQAYQQLLVTEQTMELNAAAAQSQVAIVDQAIPPDFPIQERSLPTLPLAAVAGLIVAAAIVLLAELLDDSVRLRGAAAWRLGPLLAATPRERRLALPGGQGPKRRLYVLSRPNGSAAEAIRLLRTNLRIAAAREELRGLVISSPGRREGRSTIAANLAVAMAETGQRVALIDADLRNPRQHLVFGVDNQAGLTSLLTGGETNWKSQATPIRNESLVLIPSGPPAGNPADLLSGDRLRELLVQIRDCGYFAILDTPPLLAYSDALVAAREADGLILVCQEGKTRLGALQRAVTAARRADVRVVGLVVNQAPRLDATPIRPDLVELDGGGRPRATVTDLPTAIWGRSGSSGQQTTAD